MTKEEQDYLENYIDLFALEGWKQLMQELEVRAKSYHIQGLENDKALYKAQGELSMIANLLGFESMIRQALEADTND